MSNNGRKLSRLPPPDDLAGVAVPRAAECPRHMPGALRRPHFWRGLVEGLLVALLFGLASVIVTAAIGLAVLSVRNAETLRVQTVALNGLIDRQAQTQALLIRAGMAQSSDFLSSE